MPAVGINNYPKRYLNFSEPDKYEFKITCKFCFFCFTHTVNVDFFQAKKRKIQDDVDQLLTGATYWSFKLLHL